MADSLSRVFSQFVSNLRYEKLPIEVVDKLKASLLHSMVVSIIGAGTEQGKHAIELIKQEESQERGATILSDGSKATRAGAAFANSKLMHATNQSDSYRMLLHPGPCVIPAVLASAELEMSTGKQLLTAMAAAYEVESRIGGDFIPSTQARGFRSSAVYGTLGSAVGTGKLLDLTEDQLVTCIALACTFTGGTNEGPRSGGREMMFHEPMSTRTGIMAALLARENVKGSEMSLEGDAGFYNAFVGNNRGELSYVFAGPDKVDVADILKGLGKNWEILHITPKIYPTAGYNNPVIDLMTDIRAAHSIDSKSITSINIDMNWLETTYPSPAFPNTARTEPGIGSSHYFAAYTCFYGYYPPLKERVDPGNADKGQEQQVMELMKKVTIIGHKDRPAFSPKITITMSDGTAYEGEYNGNELKWNLETEINRIQDVFSEMDWPEEKLTQLVECVQNIEYENDVGTLIGLCS
jgi:2-methylcitrate dehydratase PrpD